MGVKVTQEPVYQTTAFQPQIPIWQFGEAPQVNSAGLVSAWARSLTLLGASLQGHQLSGPARAAPRPPPQAAPALRAALNTIHHRLFQKIRLFIVLDANLVFKLHCSVEYSWWKRASRLWRGLCSA